MSPYTLCGLVAAACAAWLAFRAVRRYLRRRRVRAYLRRINAAYHARYDR